MGGEAYCELRVKSRNTNQTGLAAREPPEKGHATNKKKPKCSSRKRWPWRQEAGHLAFLSALRIHCELIISTLLPTVAPRPLCFALLMLLASVI